MQDIVGSIRFDCIDVRMIVVLSHALVVLTVRWHFEEEIELPAQGRYS